MDSAPVFLNDHTVIMIQSGYLSIYDLNQKVITHTFGPGYIGQPSTDGKQIFASRGDGLMVINARNMKESWSWSRENEKVTGQFVVTSNLIFLSTNKTVYAIDKKTHKTVWSYPAAGNLSLAKGHLFISSNYGYLAAIRVS